MNRPAEWPTLGLIVFCSAAILYLSLASQAWPTWLVVVLLSVMLALHSSLQHEVLHGHPFAKAWLNELLVCIPFGLFVPYRRFRDTHLEHHIDERLTDPYDDPESNYLDPAVWVQLPQWQRKLLRFNNTLSGRLLVGPAIGMWSFYRKDCSAMCAGDRAIIHAYLVHGITLAPWLFALNVAGSLSALAYGLAAYLALSLLRVRTFLEHRANPSVPGRTVVIEDRGFFAFLFLNNNYHLVHHMHPRVCWFELPGLYDSQRERYLQRNGGYVYPHYRAVFSRYWRRAKDPVPHPLR